MRNFILAFLITFSTFAQEKINQLDVKGNRIGLWKGIYEESKRPRYEGVFKDGKETGIFKYFDDTKAVKVIATRDFSKGDGSCYTIFFDQKGNKVSEGVLVNKKPQGEWKYYHFESKEIMTLEFYNKGLLNGTKKVFYKNNTLAETSIYKEGVLEGAYIKYAENSTILEESFYKKGEMNGVAKFYDGKGSLILKGQYKNGKRSGVWETYENGKLISSEDASKPNSKSFKYIKNEKGESVPSELKVKSKE